MNFCHFPIKLVFGIKKYILTPKFKKPDIIKKITIGRLSLLCIYHNI